MPETLTETELRERLKRIRIAREVGVLPWSHLSNPTQQFQLAGDIIDFLLSLIDSKAATVDMSVLTGYEVGFKDAASAMRDKCVEAIKTLRATPRGAAYGNAINDAVHKIESLTLDQEKLQ